MNQPKPAMLANVLTTCALIICLVGCADRKNVSPIPTISDEAKSALNSPVNCSRARQDIALLKEEKASVGKQILSGVRSIMPISAVAGILMGDYKDRSQVAIGAYNDDLEAKIVQIQTQCGVYN